MAILHPNDTAGFYKYEGEQLAWGKWVLNLDYELYADKHTEYELPVDGWYWFDSKEEAEIFFGISSTEPGNKPTEFGMDGEVNAN